MVTSQTYPGTPEQQALLRAVVAHYRDDPRVLAVIVFGSLDRGNWDEHSDLDLDVIIADGIRLDLLVELRRLCDSFAPLGERALLILPDGDEEGDVVLASLREFSIRYHPLATTSPNIVESLRVLAGRLGTQTIVAAGLANRRPPRLTPGQGLDRFARLALDADIALQRRQFWPAYRILQLMRELLLQAFALTHGGGRPYPVFEAQAPAALQERLGRTLPGYGLRSAQEALAALLDLAENDLDALANGQLQLSAAQREIIAQVRRRTGQRGDPCA